MGVIKKTDPKLGVFSADSEESLHITQGSEDEDVSSVSEIVVPQSNPIHRRLLPVPLSSINARKNLGKKRLRRYENGQHLETLLEDEELQAVTIYDFIPNRCMGFASVLENEEAKEKWEKFISSSEEKQEQVVGQRNVPLRQTQFVHLKAPEDAFRNINTGLRNALKKSQMPLGILEYLEMKLVEFFTNTPGDAFISEYLSSFERLLLHAVAQYYCLKSQSFDAEPDNIRLVRICNPNTDFHRPSMFLVKFLMERRKKFSFTVCEKRIIYR